MKREPQRTCVGCGRVTGRSSLARVTARPDGTGRGAWLCAGSEECLDQAVHRQALARALRRPVPHEEIEAFRARLLGS